MIPPLGESRLTPEGIAYARWRLDEWIAGRNEVEKALRARDAAAKAPNPATRYLLAKEEK